MNTTVAFNAAAKRFRNLHQPGALLVLPTAWDALSAAAMARAVGCEAIGTSSAGIAAVAGVPDGEQLPLDTILDCVARIVHAAGLPVSADMEGGYGDMRSCVSGVIAAGAVGVNLEDWDHQTQALRDTEEASDRIATARASAEDSSVDLFINARTDVFLRSVGDAEERVDIAISRLRRYADAGADCAFVPGLADDSAIAQIVDALEIPVNLLAMPATPPRVRLLELGVRRVSTGPHVARAVALSVERIATEAIRDVRSEALVDPNLPTLASLLP